MAVDCGYPNIDCVPTQTNTEIGHAKTVTRDGALPDTGAEVTVVVLIAVLLLVFGAMCLYITPTWDKLKDRFKP